ncbi:MAG: hypothetical protein ABJF11_02025 [Reichenbachiella sp.]|uniref:hypothetical protein n=1 Tax=Reichenbachiella sp. TaxID=2184521 RepID=UPI003265765D
MMRSFLLLITISLSTQSIWAQTSRRVENIAIFKNRVDHPIEIEVTERDDKVFFYAKNRSLYTYNVTVLFKNVINLRPAVSEKEFVVPHGSIRLIEFYKYNRDKGFQYQYSYKFKIAEPKELPDKKFPYLVPIMTETLTPFISQSNEIYENSFASSIGDTVYCMRKGLVMAVPNMFHGLDRISDQKSIEVRHEDGTIMVYKNISQELGQVKYGKYVYPGQPIAIIDQPDYIQTVLYQYTGEGKFKSLGINYNIDGNEPQPFSKKLLGKKPAFSEAIIAKELTKGELRKLKKGTLIQN